MALFLGTVSLAATLPAGSAACAADSGSFDAQAYFKRLDRNGNWYLEVSEMNPRARRYAQQLGFNPGEAIYLGYLLNKIREREGTAGQGSSNGGETGDGAVGVFGVELEEQTVPSFGIQPTKEVEIDYSEPTIQMANDVLARYDKDENGLIDEDEIKKGRWGRPDASESDEDGDGSLSRAELLNRYHQRELEKEKQKKERANEDRGKKNRSKNGDSPKGDRQQNGRDTAGKQTTKRSPQQQREQYRTYAMGLIKRYDKDKDGRLNADEWKGARRKPAGTDQNNDGFIDAEEYASALLKASNPQTNSKASGSQAATTAGGKTLPADMAKRDANQDAQVQMHEYTGDWSDALLAEFYAIDTNHDGVITPGEWQQKSK